MKNMINKSEKLLLEESFARIVRRKDQILSITLKGFLKPEHADKVSLIILSAVTELQLKLILINQKELKVLSKDIQNQFASNITKLTPLILRAAIVEPEDVFASAGLKVVQQNDHAHKGRNFPNEHEAIEWLLAAGS